VKDSLKANFACTRSAKAYAYDLYDEAHAQRAHKIVQGYGAYNCNSYPYYLCANTICRRLVSILLLVYLLMLIASAYAEHSNDQSQSHLGTFSPINPQ